MKILLVIFSILFISCNREKSFDYIEKENTTHFIFHNNPILNFSLSDSDCLISGVNFLHNLKFDEKGYAGTQVTLFKNNVTITGDTNADGLTDVFVTKDGRRWLLNFDFDTATGEPKVSLIENTLND